jgi:UDP-2,3-diacylglucosamine pyrophosphatase LpxH
MINLDQRRSGEFHETFMNESGPIMNTQPHGSPSGGDSSVDRYDCLVISDLHLGSDVCQARLLEDFLEWAVRNTRELVINGDIFDDLNFKRLTKHHFACLKIIRKNTDRGDLKVVWARGNHDGPADVVGHIVGVDILDEYIYDNGRIRLLALHGDQFDQFITRHAAITALGCGVYYYIQKLFPKRASRWVRRTSKKWQRNSGLIRDRAVEYAASRGCRFVTCGHTHLPLEAKIGEITYINSGTWTEHPPCPFVSVKGSEVRLEWWPNGIEENGAVTESQSLGAEAIRSNSAEGSGIEARSSSVPIGEPEFTEDSQTEPSELEAMRTVSTP